MMERYMRLMTLAAVLVVALVVVSADAALSQQGSMGTPKVKGHANEMSDHHQDMMDMSAMMRDPHHVLAMAYRDNMVVFATALRKQAAPDSTVDPAFARAAVAEMKRSFAQMQLHYQEHVNVASAEMKAQMADAIATQNTQDQALQSDLTALDEEVQTSTPDSKTISTLVGDILERCNGRAAMKTVAKDAKSH